MLISLHDKYSEMLEEEQAESDGLLDMVDEQIFAFKRRVSSKAPSSKSSHHRSKSSNSKDSSRSSKFGD